jgi:hypothetical protein
MGKIIIIGKIAEPVGKIAPAINQSQPKVHSMQRLDDLCVIALRPQASKTPPTTWNPEQVLAALNNPEQP